MSPTTPFLAPEVLLQQLAALMRGDEAANMDSSVVDTLVMLGDAARRARDGPNALAQEPAESIAEKIAAAYGKEAGDITPLTTGDLLRECDLAGKLVVGSPVLDQWSERGIGMPVVVNDEVPLILEDFATANDNLRQRAFPLFCDAPEGLLADLFIAGGVCQRSLVHGSAPDGDVDLFPILPAELQAATAEEQRAWGEEKFENLRAHLCALHAARGVGAAHQSRTANCVTMVFSLRDDNGATNLYEIQYILRFARSPAQVLYRFDLGSASVGWWNGEFVFSLLGSIAYQLGVNVLTLSRRRGTCEVRLVKYWARGFAAALPELALGSVPTGAYMTHLPRLAFAVSRENRVGDHPFAPETQVARSSHMEALSGAGRAQAHGYGPPPYESLEQLREYNLRQLRTAERFDREAFGMVATQNDLERGILTAKPLFPALKPTDNHRGERATSLWELQTADRFNPVRLKGIGMDRGFIMMVTQLVVDGDLPAAREMVQAFRTPEEQQIDAKRLIALEATTVPYVWGERPPSPVNAERSPLISSDRWYGDFHNAGAPAVFRVEPPVPAEPPVAEPPVAE